MVRGYTVGQMLGLKGDEVGQMQDEIIKLGSERKLLLDIKSAAEDVKNTHMDPTGRGLALIRLFDAVRAHDMETENG